ncbi:nodulation protein NodU [Mesorhizobium loti]|uniref:Nodulation protein NodU n=1 Tax=Rhizobium loti TaxID=381 RepID=M5AM25_RHILI|nr:MULTISPECIES: nodulation protein NodU [Mesorhizobium]ANN61040.1 nodulation protein NodU [Mesorhizobium loti NZP2037]OBP78546.1 nodulation protein NodU [Mesorhizobium loti]OBP82043.1 nodulation protein NodU [Mesorhizobium loti]OBP97350.1 nodulation protein NodU [Mesorhizobium loti]OBQ59008.1 nodulation protein NodU [Mesorhizobium loti]
MRICGIKLTHDGAIAVVEDGRLIFCIEQEKLNNNPRYQSIDRLETITAALAEHGLDPRDIDRFVIDGWDGEIESEFQVVSEGAPVTLHGAPYVERDANGPLTAYHSSGLMLGGGAFPYESYPHVIGHVASAYCTSSFAKAKQPAFCLIWDGFIFPRLYYVEPSGVRFVRCLFPIIGHAYAAAGQHFGPYRQEVRTGWNLDIAGKLMAYIALGAVHENIVSIFQELYNEHFAGDTKIGLEYRSSSRCEDALLAAVHGFFDVSASRLVAERPEDILASFHAFLERLLVREMTIALRQSVPGTRNLCIAGGCGLNIKWNSALRASGLFDTVWVPPFPNDSGSAIGAACCALAADKGFVHLDWSVYSGPNMNHGSVPPGWHAAPCSLKELANVLADDKPVVFLSGRAELGPRALGGRSILAAATSPQMKNHLNNVKGREHFRPVAPICLEDRAHEIFEPGTPDPYMLFDHRTRLEWKEKIPAIVHLDGTARLQTVSRKSDHPIAELLVEYEQLTGIPLLCNTSANLNGRGFFPDAAAACEWGRVDHVWCNGLLLTNVKGT